METPELENEGEILLHSEENIPMEEERIFSSSGKYAKEQKQFSIENPEVFTKPMPMEDEIQQFSASDNCTNSFFGPQLF